MRSVLVPLEQQLFPPHGLDQGALDLLVVGDEIIRRPVSEIDGDGEVLEIGRDGEEGRVVRHRDVDLDGRGGLTEEEDIAASEAETYGGDLAAGATYRQAGVRPPIRTST